ncbi:hypothetical protein [uncultured Cohaesibacter sp.]|uniref:TipJ family phage tail tip protein n=1 Tax=uncultured Cohaesibacter sp. TaxID=1002546 RepID=UPI0029C7FF48|nr:hypothetical protein [uncultured Cohaesibacter sp.]
MSGLIPIVAGPVVDIDRNRVDVTVPIGTTISEMIAIALPALSEEDYGLLRISLANERSVMLITRDRWSVVRPREGTSVVIRIVPAKDQLRSILMVVVSIAAMAVGQFWLAPYLVGAGWSTTAASIAGGLAAAGLSVAGALLVNALIPPASSRDAKNSYQISGWKNRMPTDKDVVPWIAGVHRYAPPFAAKSYTEIVGDVQYVRAVFNFGYGVNLLDDFRLGDTSLSEYDEVEIEVREGYDNDEPLTLYPRQVLEQSVNVELVRPYPRDDDGEILKNEATLETPVVRPTAINSYSASVILLFQGGLFRATDGGDIRSLTVEVRIRQRLFGAVDWTEVETLSITSQKRETFFRQYTWDLPTRGRYEIEITRMTDERTSAQVSDKCTLAGLQSIRPEYPINMSKPLSLVALRIKATYQLSGALDNFNARARRVMPVYSDNTWSSGVSRNPASAMILMLKGAHNPFPVTDEEIDYDAMADWYEWCAEKGLKFDYPLDKPMRLGEALAAICAAGRASWRHDGKQWSVVIDRPSEKVIDHLNPRNSSDFQWQRTYFDPPDGLRIKFFDETNDYEEAERIVPWPGFVGSPDLTENFEVIGKTDPDEIFIEGTRRMLELIHRPDSYSAMQSGVARIATRGDLVMGSYDVLTRTQVASRVKSISDYLVELDETVSMQANQAYGIRFKVYSTDGLGNEVIGWVTTEVRAQTGEYRSLILKDKSSVPTVGDLIHFGPLANIESAFKVKGIEPGEDFSGVVHMIDAAPQIDEIIDNLVIPAWDGIIGEQIDLALITPAVPRVTSVASGLDGTEDANGLSILLEAGTGSSAVLTAFEIDHKLSSDTGWSTMTVPAANGGSDIAGYAAGDSVDIRVRAVALGGATSAYTTTITVVIGSADPLLPGALDSELITVAGKLGHAVITLGIASDDALAQVQLYRVPTGDTLNRDLHAVGLVYAVAANSTVVLTDGDTTRANMLANAAFADASTWALGTNWAIAAGVATKTAGNYANVNQAIAFVSGKYYRVGFDVLDRTAGQIRPYFFGGSGRAGTFVSADGTHLQRLQAVTDNNNFAMACDDLFDGAIDNLILFEETSACVDQGTYDYYIEPQNDSGNPGPVSGPFTATII